MVGRQVDKVILFPSKRGSKCGKMDKKEDLNVYYISIYALFSFYANSAIYSAKVSFESPK